MTASRAFIRRACDPTGHFSPRGSSPYRKALLRAGSAPSSGSSLSGARASGAPLVQRAEGHVGAVATQHLRLRHRRHVAGLVLVAKDELADLQRRFVRVAAED